VGEFDGGDNVCLCFPAGKKTRSNNKNRDASKQRGLGTRGKKGYLPVISSATPLSPKHWAKRHGEASASTTVVMADRPNQHTPRDGRGRGTGGRAEDERSGAVSRPWRRREDWKAKENEIRGGRACQMAAVVVHAAGRGIEAMKEGQSQRTRSSTRNRPLLASSAHPDYHQIDFEPRLSSAQTVDLCVYARGDSIRYLSLC
jgi:hypothetical protein